MECPNCGAKKTQKTAVARYTCIYCDSVFINEEEQRHFHAMEEQRAAAVAKQQSSQTIIREELRYVEPAKTSKPKVRILPLIFLFIVFWPAGVTYLIIKLIARSVHG